VRGEGERSEKVRLSLSPLAFLRSSLCPIFPPRKRLFLLSLLSPLSPLPNKIGRGALLGGIGGDSLPIATASGGAVMALRGVAEVRTEAFREIRWGRFH
jgi:hypothetical protein